jgi:hypothetical protein
VTTRQWVDPLARAGLVSRGVVYLLLAWLSVEVALGRTSRPVNTKGALSAVAAHPLGWVIVAAIGLGMLGLAVWQATIALRRDPGLVRRVVAAGKAFAYTGLSAVAASVIAGHGHGGSDQISGPAMAHPWGRVLVGGIGAAVAGGAVVLAVKGFQRRYDVDITARHVAIVVVGVASMVGRAVVFLLIGALLVDAAITDQPAKTHGLDAALRTLARRPDGFWLLVGVAACLAAFGCFSAMEARLART